MSFLAATANGFGTTCKRQRVRCFGWPVTTSRPENVFGITWNVVNGLCISMYLRMERSSLETVVDLTVLQHLATDSGSICFVRSSLPIRLTVFGQIKKSLL